MIQSNVSSYTKMLFPPNLFCVALERSYSEVFIINNHKYTTNYRSFGLETVSFCHKMHALQQKNHESVSDRFLFSQLFNFRNNYRLVLTYFYIAKTVIKYNESGILIYISNKCMQRYTNIQSNNVTITI